MKSPVRGALALAVLAVTRLAVADGGSCTSPRCPDQAAVDAVQAQIAAACHCVGATNPGQHMRCATRVVAAAVKGGTLAKSCSGAVRHCQAQLGCGRGVRPFSTVQAVFKGSCALPSCHSAIARKGGLVLDEEEIAYSSLVNQPAVLPEAAGMMRVKPGDPKHSLLVRKLRGKGPGEAMPETGGLLPRETVKLIEKWVARGAMTTLQECAPVAQTTGSRGKRRACNDRPVTTGNYEWHPLPALAPPTPGTGLQIYTPPKDVPPGTEWETCFVVRPDWVALGAAAGLPADQLPVIRQQEYRMHAGSHHLLLYMYFGQHPEQWPDGYFPCSAAACINPGDCPDDAGETTIPIGGTQVGGTSYEVIYPEGVGVPVLGAKSILIANLHYTNPFQPPQPIYGESWLNLYFYAPGEFKAVLDGIFAINSRDLIVEPFTSRTISAVWQPRNFLSRAPTDAAIFQLFGHMHKRGTAFQIDYVKGGACSVSGAACGRDGDCACKPWQKTCTPGQTCVRGADAEDTRIYYTTEWDQAPVVGFDKPYLFVNRNEGLRWSCTHTNGVDGDPSHPPKLCTEGCAACGWDAASRTCTFTRGVSLGVDAAPRTYQEGEPMPLVFGLLADDDMCNMFGYFIDQVDLARLP
jgi:hypothetical protein